MFDNSVIVARYDPTNLDAAASRLKVNDFSTLS